MKPFLLHGILILLLNTTVYSATLHGVWGYENDTYIDGFALYEVVGVNYVPIEENIPKTDREIFFDLILVGKECKQFALTAWWDNDSVIVHSDYALAPGCAKPDSPLLFIIE